MYLNESLKMYLNESLTIAQMLDRQKDWSDPSTYPVYTNISNLSIQAWVGMRSLSYQMVVRGDTGSYMTTIIFDGVEFKPIQEIAPKAPVKPVPIIKPVKPATKPIKPTAASLIKPSAVAKPTLSKPSPSTITLKPGQKPQESLNEADVPLGPEWKEIVVAGKKFAYRIPSLSKNNARVRCTCSEWAFRWSRALEYYKAIVGPFHKYTRKTPFPPKGLPVKNPGHMPGQLTKSIPGICKHLLSAVRYLHNAGLVRE